jgi:hypothetical protein
VFIYEENLLLDCHVAGEVAGGHVRWTRKVVVVEVVEATRSSGDGGEVQLPVTCSKACSGLRTFKFGRGSYVQKRIQANYATMHKQTGVSFKKQRNRIEKTNTTVAVEYRRLTGQPVKLRASRDNNEALIVQKSHETVHKSCGNESR